MPLLYRLPTSQRKSLPPRTPQLSPFEQAEDSTCCRNRHNTDVQASSNSSNSCGHTPCSCTSPRVWKQKLKLLGIFLSHLFRPASNVAVTPLRGPAAITPIASRPLVCTTSVISFLCPRIIHPLYHQDTLFIAPRSISLRGYKILESLVYGTTVLKKKNSS